MNVSFQIIGHNVKSARRALGLTLEQAAKRACMSAQYFGQIERGEQNASTKLLAQIADALHTSIHALLHGCILDKENHPALFESPDLHTQEYSEYALLILSEYQKQIRRYYEKPQSNENALH